MAAASRHEGSLHITETLSAQAVRFPAGSFDDDDIAAGANIAASKLDRHESINIQHCAEAATVEASSSQFLHIVRGSTGSLVGFEGIVHTVASATTQLCYLDLQKATASTTYVSVLSAPISFASTDAVRTPKAGTINSAGLSDGDILRTVVTVTGSTANFFKGLGYSLTYSERYS